MGQLDGQKIVIIGGSAGIGYATAEMALGEGAEVVIAARDRVMLEKAAAQLSDIVCRPVTWRSLDIADRTAVAAFLADCAPIDHLLLPGSTIYREIFEELDEAKSRAFFDSKFWGPFWAAYDSRTLIRRGGSILFYSGAARRRPLRGYVVGSTIDGAIDAATRSLATNFGPLGIRVNCISPGIVRTRISTAGRTAEETAAWHDEHAARLPVGRVGEPAECALGAIYLMANGFVTGEVLAIDGGVEAIP